TDARRIFVAGNVRTQRQRSNHRSDVEKEDGIPSAQVGYLAAQPHLGVGPKNLIREPQTGSDCNERPEKANSPLGAQSQWDKSCDCRDQKKTLNHVAEGSERERPAQ